VHTSSTEAEEYEMPRRREVPKREILPDPKYGNVDVCQIRERVHADGKKSVAERIIYGAFEQIEAKTAAKIRWKLFATAHQQRQTAWLR